MEQEEEPAPELPPPMKPIQNPAEFVQSSSTGSNSKTSDDVEKNRASGFNPISRTNKNDLAEIEQIVKEKMVSFIFNSGSCLQKHPCLQNFFFYKSNLLHFLQVLKPNNGHNK